jgi:hypothetical protein
VGQFSLSKTSNLAYINVAGYALGPSRTNINAGLELMKDSEAKFSKTKIDKMFRLGPTNY